MTFPITPIFAAVAAHGENQLLELGSSSTASNAASSGGSIARTIVGLGIVILVIFGLRWVLKQFKHGREKKAAGGGLSSMATWVATMWTNSASSAAAISTKPGRQPR